MKKGRLIDAMASALLAASCIQTATHATEAGEKKPETFRKISYPTYDLSKDKVLYVIGYAHLDTQFRWTYQDTIREYILNTMRHNFRLFEKYPNYVFNFTGSRRYMMMKEYYPKDFEKVTEYIAKGRWHVCGSSVDEGDMNVSSPESIIRHILYGNGYFRKEFGKDSVDFMLPDCFGFPASLPSIFAHCGLKGFSTQKLTWGSAVGIPFNVGVWEGPDGQSVVAALNPGDYVGHVKGDLSQSKEWIKRIEDLGKQAGVYTDYHYYGTGDRGGAPDEESVQWIERSIAGKGPIHVVTTPADQMFRDLNPEQIAKLPRYKGDLLLTEHSAGSITSQAYMKRWNRKNELLADTAERASVAAEWLGAAAYPRKKLTDAWHLVLGSQMHDILPGTSIPSAYEFSWNDEVVALNQFAAVLEDAAGAVTQALDTRCQGISIAVFNPLSIEREDVVEAKVHFPAAAPKAVRVSGPDSKEVPSQMVERKDNTLEVIFLAKVPSVGFAVYDVRAAKTPCTIATGLKVTKSTLENTRYRVRLDENGDVASIHDKAADRELLAAPARLAFLHDAPQYWPAWNIDWQDRKEPPRAYVEGPAKVRIVESGPARVAIEVTREAEGSKFIQRIRLAAGGSRIEFDTRINWQTKETCLKASFPLSVSNPKATYNWGLGTIQRTNNDPKKYEVPSHQWFDLTDTSGAYGVAVLEDCKFGSDKPDDNTLRLTLLRTPKCRQMSYDQATQDIGHHEMIYALTGHKGDWRQGRVVWEAARLNQPLVAFQTLSHKGKLGKSFSLLKVNTPQVAVRAIKKAEESDDIIIRLQELHGQPAKNVRISMAAAIISAREVNGQEQSLGEVAVQKGRFVLDIGAYRPRAFALKLGAPPEKLAPPACKPIEIPYDIDVVSLDADKADGNFDGQGHSMPGELLPATVISEGIHFKIGPTTAGQKNALACRGQNIKLPQGKYNRLYLLAAAAGGDTTGTFKIDGKPIELTIQEWSGYVGQWDNRIWKSGYAGQWDTCIWKKGESGVSGLQPGFIKRDTIAWVGTHRHHKNNQNEPYIYCYLFKYRLDLPEGAKVLTLPDNDRIYLFAATTAVNANDDTKPAQFLYDTLDRAAMPPQLDPAGG